MAHELRDARSFVTYRIPAWHKLGYVLEAPMTAVEAAQKVGLPDISTEELFLQDKQSTGHKAILGTWQGERAVYSIVTSNYHEITHAEFVGAWDRAIQAPLETLGILGKGERLFASAKLPTVNIHGDEVDMYLLGYNPLNGKEATTVRVTPVRVVCANTLALSTRSLVRECRVIHSSGAAQQFEKFLREAWDLQVATTTTLVEAMNILAARTVTNEECNTVLADVYSTIPLPTQFAKEAESEEGLAKLAAWERENGAQIQHRTRCNELFAGQGRGALTRAANGTAWGLYNAVAEYEDYYKRARQDESRAFGQAAKRKSTAFESCIALVS